MSLTNSHFDSSTKQIVVTYGLIYRKTNKKIRTYDPNYITTQINIKPSLLIKFKLS